MALRYEGVFDDSFEAEPFSMDNPGQGVMGTITQDAAFFLAGSGPWTDMPETFRVSVIAPKGIYAVMEGRLETHTDDGDRSLSIWSVARPSGPLAMFSGRYVIDERTLEKYALLAAGAQDFPLSTFRSRFNPASQAVGYGKAMFVFHMAVTGDTVSRRQTVSLDDATAKFSVRMPEAPRIVAADPDFDVFRLLCPEEIPATVNAVKGSSALAAVLAEDSPYPWTEIFQGLLMGLNHGGTRVLSESRFAAEDTAGMDVIFFGMPKYEKGRAMLSELGDAVRSPPGGASGGGHHQRQCRYDVCGLQAATAAGGRVSACGGHRRRDGAANGP